MKSCGRDFLIRLLSTEITFLRVTFIRVCVGIENRESSWQVKGKSSNVMLNVKHPGNQTHSGASHSL